MVHTGDRWIVYPETSLAATVTDIYYAPFGARDMTLVDDIGPWRDIEVKEIRLKCTDSNVKLGSIDAHFLDGSDKNLWEGEMSCSSLAYYDITLPCNFRLTDCRNLSITVRNSHATTAKIIAISVRYEPIR